MSSLVRYLRQFPQNLVFEAVLLATEVKSLHESKNLKKMFPKSVFFLRKNIESTFFTKKCQFSIKKVGMSEIFA